MFNGAISNAAKVSIRKAIRKVFNPRWSQCSLESFADVLNPKIRGWIGYYSRFYRKKAENVFHYLDRLIVRWIGNKYKLTSVRKCVARFKSFRNEQASLFYHWKLWNNARLDNTSRMK